MNSTNDDATKPIRQQNGEASPAASEPAGESRTAALSGAVTSRIAAIKKAAVNATSGDAKGASRSTSRTSGAASAPAGASGASRTPGAGPSALRTPSANTADGAPRTGPRRVRLTLARLDPWSVMKLSFLVAIAVGIASIIATALLWSIVDAIGLWDQLNQIGRDLNNDQPLPFMEYFEFTKMISYTTLVAFLNVIIMTALGTLIAFLYNIVAALLGGLKLTFTDE
ncbi:MAG: DUF3566 domain-containing protein [Dermabacter sp.]|nr:DUF3566 domain-containing protein [Dermabacter sp.]